MATRAKPAKVRTPRASRKLTIGVGLVNFEVGIRPLWEADNGPRGKTLCATHNSPIKQAHYCEHGDHYTSETVIGFETAAGYVQVDRDAVAADRDGRIELGHLVDVGDIDPLYFEKPYMLWPTDGHGTAFDLIATVLQRTGKALTGHTVLSRSTRMVVLRWSDHAGCLLMHLCQFDANIRWDDVELVTDATEARPAAAETHLAAAEQLLETMAGEFEPTGDDDYAIALEQAIAAAAAGKPIPTVADPEPAAPVIDLMAALTASVDAAKANKPKPRKKVAA